MAASRIMPRKTQLSPTTINFNSTVNSSSADDAAANKTVAFGPIHCNNASQEALLLSMVSERIQKVKFENDTLIMGPYDEELQASIGNVMSAYFCR
jgi:hypothetical protein